MLKCIYKRGKEKVEMKKKEKEILSFSTSAKNEAKTR